MYMLPEEIRSVKPHEETRRVKLPEETTSLNILIPSKCLRYVSFISPEFLSTQLEHKHAIRYRILLLLLRLITLTLSCLIVHNVQDLFLKTRSKTELCVLLTVGIVSILVNSACILNWVWTRVYSFSQNVLLTVDLKQTEESPLLQQLVRRTYRERLLYYLHLVMCIAWTGAGMALLCSNWRCPINTQSLYLKCEIPWTPIHLTFGSILSWLLGAVLVWLDLNRGVGGF
ncbi:hypothetical protein K7432_010277 [Basidiobolus ranarum]|uniref:Uncharacterized protein n=1 Tax=Basidiobolus ranarum TaxID=34480 RepID=A0ABR2VWM7_9FUNG